MSCHLNGPVVIQQIASSVTRRPHKFGSSLWTLYVTPPLLAMEPHSSYPVVVAMKGHPGTGKSTLARAVAAALRFPLLDKDDIRDCTLTIEQILSSASSSPAALLNDLSYSVLFRTAETQLRLGLSVIIDSPLSRRSHLDTLVAAAGRSGARVVVIECRPGDEEEWRRRLEARGGGGESWHKPATWRELERLVERYRGCVDYEVGDVARLVVDTTALATEELVARVVEFLKYSA